MIETDDKSLQHALINHGSKDEQIARLKHKLLFWRVVGIVGWGMIIEWAVRGLCK